jgi:hypothetical protein
MFSKTFNTVYGQVVLIKQWDDEGDPEIRYYVQPQGQNTCSMAFNYDTDEVRDSQFDKATLETAAQVAEEICKHFE